MSRESLMILSIIVITAILLTAGLCLILYFKRREKRLLERIQSMLDQAIAGSFEDTRLDESGISAVESAMHRFLSDSCMSYEKLALDKEHIQTLISDISHQIVTPLSNIMLYTQLLEEWDTSGQGLQTPGPPVNTGENDIEKGEVLEAIRMQAEKLEFLVEALVKVSRMEAGLIRIQAQEQPLQPVLAAVKQQFIRKAKSKQLCFTTEPTQERAVFDRKWTIEAVANIVDNAIKYTPRGGTVSIRVQPYSFFTCISVSDNGPGIPEEEHAEIFTRFYRRVEHAEAPGLGIGLYLAREVMKAQGGYIKLTSRPSEGSTFSLFLKRN
ncbi:MAG: HAMP domain-containing histidine kinase [Firmicutes bacterium]|nr:HAMP domain-containing histidine kinase [Bacillota bacterium]